jgi:hypothetical protein
MVDRIKRTSANLRTLINLDTITRARFFGGEDGSLMVVALRVRDDGCVGLIFS